MNRYLGFNLIIALLLLCQGCNSSKVDIVRYHQLIDEAETSICNGQVVVACNQYNQAFKWIDVPFGHDLFNAALCAGITEDKEKFHFYLQDLINRTRDISHIEKVFKGTYLTEEEWQTLVSNRKVLYYPSILQEMEVVNERDQLYRPMYDTHDDTINSIRKDNLRMLIDLQEEGKFPSQVELGYDEYLINQPHHIVLYHTGQRRSKDKTTMDLKPMLRRLVKEGRLNPEKAIQYLNFQQDQEKGRFEIYTSWMYKHPSLPDSLNSQIWYPSYSPEEVKDFNKNRSLWSADAIEDIIKKTNFLNDTNLPFIFASVRNSVANLSSELDSTSALMTYNVFTKHLVKAD